MSSTSNASSSGSSAANTVVVTARDIEFSNYNSSTGKWGNAVLTMMIMDAVTEELEGYSEKVYATFRNHVDPTDVITFSAEVDGLDTRVTTSDPMVASAKYELYKVYGETSGDEYATSSQFYIQVPGKVWDFANDVVEEDVELVSDWFNYGYIKDVNDVTYGITSPSELLDVVTLNNDTGVATVNGSSITRQDVKEVKITSMLNSNLTATSSWTDHNNKYFLNSFNNLEHIDIVSARITKLIENSSSYPTVYGIGGNKFNDRFAFPDTLTVATLCSSNSTVFDRPVYFPDSVVRICQAMHNIGMRATYNKKIRFSPNIRSMSDSNFSNLGSWDRDIYPLSENTQLGDGSQSYFFMASTGFNKPFTIPSTWTRIPSYFMESWSKWEQDLVIPEGIVSIGNSAIHRIGKIKSVTFPSTLRSIGTDVLSYCGSYSTKVKIKNLQNTQVTNISNGFCGSFSYVDMSEFGWPSSLRTIGNGVFGFSGGLYDFPQDEDGFGIFEFPEGLTSIGTDFCYSKGYSNDPGRRIKFVMPSTLTSIGKGFSHSMSGVRYSSSVPTVVKADFTKISPSVFADNDTQSFRVVSDSYLMPVEIEIAPGTKEEWEAKLPDIPGGNAGRYFRKINWVEKPTRYGYVFYETNYIDTNPTKGYVELQSMADFNKFINGPSAVIDSAITVDTDDQGNTIELHFGTASMSSQGTNINTITGFYIGTDITVIPDHFLRSYRYLKRLKWGGNETSIGSYVGYNSGMYTKNSDRPGNYDLANIPDAVTAIGQDFFSNSIMNEEVHIPNLVTSLSSFLTACTSFNQPITIPDSITSLSGFLSDCISFNQPITIPDSVTSLSSFLTACTSFNQPITIPDSVTSISTFLFNCASFNQPITIPDSVTTISNFMAGCTSFNQPITIPDSVTSISDFLYRCTSFNQPISINNTVSISGFLNGCTAFNSTVTINNVGSHSMKQTTGFLTGCSAFNKPLDLSPFQGSNQFVVLANCSSFNSQLILPTSIRQGSILHNGSAFNQPITLPNYTEGTGIYSSLCYGWTSFNQPVTIPASWCKARWYNNATLFENCDSLTSAVTFSSTTVPSGVDSGVIQKSFSTTNETAAAYTTGVTFTGTGAQAWKDVLPDSTASPYRKINVV